MKRRNEAKLSSLQTEIINKNQKVAEKPSFFRIFIGLGWASDKKAEELYRKAISLDPNSIMYNWYCAKLLEETGKYKQSRSIPAKIPDMSATYQEDPKYKSVSC